VLPPKLPPVVDLAWLTAARSGSAVAGPLVVADVRYYLDGRSGRAAYDGGHLPGAVFVDLDRWLAGPPSLEAGRHPLPSPETFAEGMSTHGIGDDTVVVAYDDDGGVMAARLVWLLRVTGHEAALLDGGIQAWDGLLETAEPEPVLARFTARPWPADRLATVDDVTDGGLVVLDARAGERYRGEVEPIDPRAGHVPGALSLPCRENLLPDKRFLPDDELRARFGAVGVRTPDDVARVVSYCGSGVNACHTLLTLEHLGLGQARLYPGSWSQYCADPRRPVATGPEPGSGQPGS
jgi:thiosulfate/3-mercaptopyruvate sulfurtransferase